MRAKAYIDAAQEGKADNLQVLERLALANVCPRCALRHVGVRGAVFAAEAPSQAEFVDALRGEMRSQGQASASAPAADGAASANQQPQGPSVTAAPSVCPACWGVLQALDGQAPGWSFDRIADAVKAEGYKFSKFSLELLLPPSLAVRQVSIAWELVRLFPSDTQVSFIARAGAPGNDARAGVVSVKEALKLALLSALSERLQAEPEVESLLRVTLSFSHGEDAAETGFLNIKHVPQGSHAGSRRRGGHWNKRQKTEGETEAPAQGELYPQAVKALSSLHNTDVLGMCRPPLQSPASPVELAVSVSRGAMYIGGYYTKEARGMCQSPWLVGGGTESVGSGSVTDSIERLLLPAVRADSCKFMSAGREDMDVRMLGSGRPFCFEMQNQRADPLSPEECRALEAAIAAADSGVAVRSLQPVTKAQRDLLIEGDGEKDKEYRALCVFARPLSAEDVAKLAAVRDLEIQQKTPVRVLHRRAALTRPRVVNWRANGTARHADPSGIKVELVPGSPRCAIVDLRCQAGTYVKEFVHGDFGRTRPSLGGILGCQADILQLDVTSVNLLFV